MATGFVVLAKGKSKITLWAEALNDSVWILLTWLCVQQWGLNGAGIAFALLYVFGSVLFLIITKIIADTTWTRSNFLHIFWMGVFLAVIATNCHFSPDLLYTNKYLSSVWIQWGINLLLLFLLSFYCLRRLLNLTGITIKMILNKMNIISNNK